IGHGTDIGLPECTTHPQSYRLMRQSDASGITHMPIVMVEIGPYLLHDAGIGRRYVVSFQLPTERHFGRDRPVATARGTRIQLFMVFVVYPIEVGIQSTSARQK